jgi:ubiquinone biosynthesis protein
VTLSLRLENLKRYKDLAYLLWKYGGNEMIAATGLSGALDEPATDEERAEAEELAGDLERLGPTYVKLGQMLSTRADLLPAPYLIALRRLQDDVEPFPYEEAEGIIESELEVRVSKAFGSLESKPLGAASLGQVHAATLRDGRPVVVKVQRPGVRERVLQDLAAFHELAGALDRHTEMGRRYRFRSVLHELEKSLLQEMDYEAEAANLVALGTNLERYDALVVPRPIPDYTTSRVLTMERLDGTSLSHLSPLALQELDGAALAYELFDAYLRQVLVDGLFHADPHPGNVFLLRDGRLGLLDLGMVGHVRPATQEHLLKLLLGIGDGDGDQVAEHSLRMSRLREDHDREGFCHEIGELVARESRSKLHDIEIGSVILEITQIAGNHGVVVSSELTLLGKTLLNLDQIGRTLDPHFEPAGAIRKASAALMQERMRQSASPANLFSSLLEAKELAENLPGRLNRIMGRLADNDIRVRVDAFDERKLMEGFEKVANRITIGLVIAALIIGAGLMMNVRTPFTLFGYPGFAMICFLIALVAGLRLVWTIFWEDRENKR